MYSDRTCGAVIALGVVVKAIGVVTEA